MWRYVLAFVVVASSAAEAGQARTTFQVGLTITGTTPSPVRAQTRLSTASVPLPRRRPLGFSAVTKSQGKPKLAADSE
jgi:hypothetical protein